MAVTDAVLIKKTNTISGKVIVKESGIGIPDLVVLIFELDQSSEPEIELKTDRKGGLATSLDGVPVDRLGSVLTKSDGTFTLTYTDDEFRITEPGDARPDLFLLIISPEDVNADGVGIFQVLYRQLVNFRQNAGRTESCVIRLTREQLEKAEIPIPTREETVDDEVNEYIATQQTRFGINTGITAFHQQVIAPDIEEKKVFREKIIKGIVPNLPPMEDNGVVIRDGDIIREKVSDMAVKGIEKANRVFADVDPGSGVPVNLYLTPDDRERLKDYFNDAENGIATIPESAIRPILFRTNSSENFGTLLIHNNPIAKYCREETVEELCAEDHLEGDEEDEDEDEDHTHSTKAASKNSGSSKKLKESGESTVDLEDIPVLISRIISEMPSPDSVQTPGTIPTRPDEGTIEDSVDAFSLGKGAAETPAYYDFHSLQIAFEHVWKQLFDENIINHGYRLHQDLKSRAGLSVLNGDSASVADIADLMATAGTSLATAVPAEVAAQFEITKEEWQELPNAFQKKLFFLALSINNILYSKQKGGVVVPKKLTLDSERLKQFFVEQGEKIIDTVRHDDYYTMHKTLRDLHLRLSGNYEYTVFAADKDHYSVNFGILNTFRQEWVPLNYQVGRLCKTIPLAPKEERKYSLKVTKHVKRSEKETRKSNTSFSSERIETSRTEAEIIAKAQNKTNFNLTSQGTYNIGLSKGTSTTSLGIEAIKDTQEARKDFREAVLKSVQEYKDERSIDISTEESTTYESTDSGTISNPNDELAVTYLFYELQRRYRISEQLYRVTPVVLVAQPVPQPDEITEAWVIAHDWIINKHLLDDSFKDCLTYLSKKSVGDDFAIRELRRNLRMQRNLVDVLRLELTVARYQTENRYRALEDAVMERIDEESEETTDGWFSDVGDFFGGGGQDPEAAKARELAAKDAHQQAVEKAEKIASGLQQEVNALHKITEEYNKALRTHLDAEVQIKRLLVHLRDNIIYYMQAIWSMEPPDQRFLRLQKVDVPHLELIDPEEPGRIEGRMYKVEVADSEDIFGAFRLPGTEKHKALMTGQLKKPPVFKPLIQVADLDKPLGFKGNYIIFPLKQHNALTEFMAAPYIDDAFGAMDPDEFSNLNLNDFSDFICCLHDRDPELFEELKPLLQDWFLQLQSDPIRNGDEIVIPSGSLYIEALPAAHPLLEDFKLRHRQLDVFKNQAEARKMELENLRYAARLLSDEREDPDADKKVLFEGINNNIGIDVNE